MCRRERPRRPRGGSARRAPRRLGDHRQRRSLASPPCAGEPGAVRAGRPGGGRRNAAAVGNPSARHAAARPRGGLGPDLVRDGARRCRRSVDLPARRRSGRCCPSCASPGRTLPAAPRRRTFVAARQRPAEGERTRGDPARTRANRARYRVRGVRSAEAGAADCYVAARVPVRLVARRRHQLQLRRRRCAARAGVAAARRSRVAPPACAGAEPTRESLSAAQPAVRHCVAGAKRAGRDAEVAARLAKRSGSLRVSAARERDPRASMRRAPRTVCRRDVPLAPRRCYSVAA